MSDIEPRSNHAKSPELSGIRAKFRVPAADADIRTDPSTLPETPEPSTGLLGLVSRIARRALDLGLSDREPTFHVFVSTVADVTLENDIVRAAERAVAGRKPPSDVVYVHNFDRPEAPYPLELPAGQGLAFARATHELIETLAELLPTVGDLDDVRQTHREQALKLDAQNKSALNELEATAKALGFGVKTMGGGIQTFPVLHGKPVSPEQFDVLDEPTRKSLGEAEEHLTREVEKAAKRVRLQNVKFDAARREALGKVAQECIHHEVDERLASFAAIHPAIAAHVERVRQALADDWEDFVKPLGSGPDSDGDGVDGRDSDPEFSSRLDRFMVNVLVGTDPQGPAPVVYETNPTHSNLFGYLERRARAGTLITDCSHIRAGSIQRASGGILIVRAADILAEAQIWDRLKRVLREQRIAAEDAQGSFPLNATTLHPIPAPVRTRVVLIGPPDLYAALSEADTDFTSLFRVKVEVDSEIPRTLEATHGLDAYLMAMARDRGWGSFERSARAHLIDLSTRLAGDREKLAITLAPLEETAAFASMAATESTEAPGVVTLSMIEHAWRERRERLGLAERHLREITLRGEVTLTTAGEEVGVVNGLSVFCTGDVEFGQPMRITAVVALGREGIIDVEREAQLGGSIHTKGVAILRGYLGHMFGRERPLSIRVQLAFEQSYGEIDGDSASSSELFAILSALADVGIDQGIAVTGSVNQLGGVQAIGGVCAKVEGFFDLCAARGLTGAQGVMLPRSNIPHLVLRDDVVSAIADQRFHLYAIDTVAQGIEILTGLPAGERDAAGHFPAGSVFGRVERRVIEIAEKLRRAEGQGPHEGLEITDEGKSKPMDGNDFRMV